MSDDKIAEIRARHEAGPIGHLPIAAFSLADDDRATLLVEVDRLRAEVARLRADRRERIATAALQGLLSEGDLRGEPQTWAERATVFADALAAKLDQEKGKP